MRCRCLSRISGACSFAAMTRIGKHRDVTEASRSVVSVDREQDLRPKCLGTKPMALPKRINAKATALRVLKADAR